MTDTLLDLSDKIEAVCVELLENVVDIAAGLKIAFFVVGATARDMILIHGYNIQTIRATYDIDLGVQVSDWNEYQSLTNELMASGHFSKEQIRDVHRYIDCNSCGNMLVCCHVNKLI
jgi:predicted nucleotidyltransferase